MEYCKKCGNQVLETDTFCVACGTRLKEDVFCATCGAKLKDNAPSPMNIGVSSQMYASAYSQKSRMFYIVLLLASLALLALYFFPWMTFGFDSGEYSSYTKTSVSLFRLGLLMMGSQSGIEGEMIDFVKSMLPDDIYAMIIIILLVYLVTIVCHIIFCFGLCINRSPLNTRKVGKAGLILTIILTVLLGLIVLYANSSSGSSSEYGPFASVLQSMISLEVYAYVTLGFAIVILVFLLPKSLEYSTAHTGAYAPLPNWCNAEQTTPTTQTAQTTPTASASNSIPLGKKTCRKCLATIDAGNITCPQCGFRV